ncbi:phosphoglycolate phosphatase, bacterial [Methylovorus sp. MM2]|uniref:HAD family hydrolase n=1 Tax=Methylovorus sp. MM2 TaxID=1848038 RepID=UPI0007DFF3E0|nr:HAD-IA family hydrolase [Methylovorus sp. MM2]OAM53087.1 phosphoglycolate phosphatase, bacterial [Methylovorus sp. MM2]
MSKAILFDLDGTLIDTATDLGLALNLQRERHGLPRLPDAQIRPFASHGSKGLLSIGFGLTPEDPDFESMRTEYLDLYDQVFTQSPILFDGVQQVLDAIEAKGLPWGIVTNKPKRFTEPLLKSIALYTRAACVVSGDSAARPKPYPDSLLMACEQMGISATDCLYVGDAERDIQAGRAAGMKTVVALYGYIDASETPQSWGADMQIANAQALLDLI